MSGPHQVEENALAYTPIGDPQSTNRPSRTDRVENGATAQHQIGALTSDARVGGVAVKVETGKAS